MIFSLDKNEKKYQVVDEEILDKNETPNYDHNDLKIESHNEQMSNIDVAIKPNEKVINIELGKIIKTEDWLMVKGVKNTRVFKCHLCEFKGNSYKTKCHIKSDHLGVFEKKCTSCDFVATSLKIYRSHYSKLHRYKDLENIYKCDNCEYSTNIKGSLKKHKITHQSTKYECDQCNKTYSCSSSFNDHKLIHTNEAKECCGKSFTKRNYRDHIRYVHSMNKNLKCKHCEFIAKNEKYLHNHMRLKHEAPKIQCNQCEFITHTYQKLQNHEDLKHTNIEYKCDICEYKGKSRWNLRNHNDLRHKRVIKCDECDYTTTRKDALNQHVDIEHKKIRYPCDQCTYQAPRKYHLSSHMRKVHGTQ